MPTEVEWEFAARGGTDHRYSGSNDVDMVANMHAGRWGPVGRKQANAYGLFDMSGNLWEWCWDKYSPYAGRPDLPQWRVNDEKRVLRGGGWRSGWGHDTGEFRVANRASAYLTYRNDDVGIRLVRSWLDGPPPEGIYQD